MKVWGHTLFQNESKWLWFSVMSAVNHLDKILLWDAGSTDGSFEIAKAIKDKYPKKIDLKQVGKLSSNDFTKVRQEMLEQTTSDWFLMLDGDEIWWEGSIKKLINQIKRNEPEIESIVVPTLNLVGDIFHYQEKAAGKYRFGELKGNYNLRAIKRSIPGLYSKNPHGTWGWADKNKKMIQDRNTFKFLNAPYLHATFLPRSGSSFSDKEVNKRFKKLKHEIGESFPLDFYYPEVFFKERPKMIKSPWKTMDFGFETMSYIQTPLRKFKRRFLKDKVGY